MTIDSSGRAEDDDARPAVDDDRLDFDDADEGLPDHLDLPLETPEADAIDQHRAAPLDDEV